MSEKQQLLKLYDVLCDKDRTVLLAIIIVMSEGTEEEKAELQELAFTRHEEARGIIYNKYHLIVQQHIEQEAAC